jgi:hypothetical protein
MDWKWLSDLLLAIFGNIIYDLVLAGVVGAVLAYLRAKKEKWAGPALYGLAGFAMIMVIAVTFVGRPLLSTKQPETTAENIQENIKAWADKFSLGIQKGTDGDFAYIYSISLSDGHRILVGQPKGSPGYVQFLSIINLAPDDRSTIQKMSPAKRQHFTDEIVLEMARSKIVFSLHGQYEAVGVFKMLPIAGLNEYTFLTNLDELDSATIQVIQAVKLTLFADSTIVTPPAAPSR